MRTGTHARTTVATDGNGGLGRTIVTRFISDPADVAVSDLAPPMSGGFLLSIICDVTKLESVKRSLKQAREVFGTVRPLEHVLVRDRALGPDFPLRREKGSARPPHPDILTPKERWSPSLPSMIA